MGSNELSRTCASPTTSRRRARSAPPQPGTVAPDANQRRVADAANADLKVFRCAPDREERRSFLSLMDHAEFQDRWLRYREHSPAPRSWAGAWLTRPHRALPLQARRGPNSPAGTAAAAEPA